MYDLLCIVLLVNVKVISMVVIVNVSSSVLISGRFITEPNTLDPSIDSASTPLATSFSKQTPLSLQPEPKQSIQDYNQACAQKPFTNGQHATVSSLITRIVVTMKSDSIQNASGMIILFRKKLDAVVSIWRSIWRLVVMIGLIMLVNCGLRLRGEFWNDWSFWMSHLTCGLVLLISIAILGIADVLWIPLRRRDESQIVNRVDYVGD